MVMAAPSHFEDRMRNPHTAATMYNVLNVELKQPDSVEKQKDLMNAVMDMIDTALTGKPIVMGYRYKDGEWQCTPDEQTFLNHALTKKCRFCSNST